MREAQVLVGDTLSASVDKLCQNFGVMKTARALLLAALRHRLTKNHTSHLSNRMRRDIGLSESDDVLLESRFSLWDIRF